MNSADQIPDDGLKWFGEGFDGFPKRLPDDCVEYAIHVLHGGINSVAALRTRLGEIQKAANELKKKHLKDYIWQRQGFDLNIHPKIDLSKPDAASSAKTPPRLQGRSDFGDSIADEWLIVHLLREVSKQCPDAWIRVYDTDGEFLLIESANALPKWLNPDIAENRVWINDGRLKIIALEDGAPPQNLSLQDALATIKRNSSKLLLDPAIEKEAFHRLREYPSAISSSLHRSLVTIPRRLAYILHRNPTYISPAIESFYLRDPISLKPLTTKDISTLSFPPEDFVTTSVKFTKVGFAQLRSQLFDPPPAWIGIAPRMHDQKAAIGMKLTCGFEMLVNDPQSQDKRAVREIRMLLEDIESGDESLPTDSELCKWPKPEDDEKWLDIDYKDFEKELDGKGGEQGNGGFGDQGAQENLRKMVSRFEDFMKDDDAGADGIDEEDDEEDEEELEEGEEPSFTSTKPADPSQSAEKQPPVRENTEEDEAFERAMHDTKAMPGWHLEKSGLLDEARKLALQDEEDDSDMSIDEDEEMRKVIALMEQELKGHGVLSLDQNGTYRKTKKEVKPDGRGKNKAEEQKATTKSKPTFGPPRPPNMLAKATQESIDAGGKPKKDVRFDSLPNPIYDVDTRLEYDEESADEEVSRPSINGSRPPTSKTKDKQKKTYASFADEIEDLEPTDDVELSSDDDEFNDVDLGLAKNMLEAFKGQAGMSGPAGNLMKALGVGMPRDEGEESD